jgi:hypothetical protein
LLTVLLLWAVAAHVATLVVHILTYTGAAIANSVLFGVFSADVALLVVFAWTLKRMPDHPAAGSAPVPTPRWLFNLGGLVVLFGIILLPYCIANFLFLVSNHPTKRIPAHAEIRLATGHGLVLTYIVVVVIGRALARYWWPGARWIDGGPAAGRRQ